MSNPKFMLGYDYQWLSVQGDKRPLYAPIGHTIVVGGSGSGKSTSVLCGELGTNDPAEEWAGEMVKAVL